MKSSSGSTARYRRDKRYRPGVLGVRLSAPLARDFHRLARAQSTTANQLLRALVLDELAKPANVALLRMLDTEAEAPHADECEAGA
jgi:hypothetical protein